MITQADLDRDDNSDCESDGSVTGFSLRSFRVGTPFNSAFYISIQIFVARNCNGSTSLQK